MSAHFHALRSELKQTMDFNTYVHMDVVRGGLISCLLRQGNLNEQKKKNKPCLVLFV